MYDVIIIGSGPAGYTAATYTSRAFLKTLVLTGPQPGGQLTTTTMIDNFPGFSQGIMGTELLGNMQKQAERFGAALVMDVVHSVISSDSEKSPRDPSQKPRDDNQRNTFIVKGQNQEYEAKSVIIATGASAKTLGIPSEDKFRGKGISYCATCDGFFFRGKHIAVLGGGDTAMEEATFLTKFASHVTIIHRRDQFRASPIMLEKARKDPKISFLLNKEVVEFIGDETIKTVRLKDNKTGKIEDVDFDGTFVAIGHTPATAFLNNVVGMDEKGYIQIRGMRSATDAHTQTSVEGIFAAGDCVDMRYRQGIVAAGMGAMAAMDVEKYLQK